MVVASGRPPYSKKTTHSDWRLVQCVSCGRIIERSLAHTLPLNDVWPQRCRSNGGGFALVSRCRQARCVVSFTQTHTLRRRRVKDHCHLAPWRQLACTHLIKVSNVEGKRSRCLVRHHHATTHRKKGDDNDVPLDHPLSTHSTLSLSLHHHRIAQPTNQPWYMSQLSPSMVFGITLGNYFYGFFCLYFILAFLIRWIEELCRFVFFLIFFSSFSVHTRCTSDPFVIRWAKPWKYSSRIGEPRPK